MFQIINCHLRQDARHLTMSLRLQKAQLLGEADVTLSGLVQSAILISGEG